MAHRKYVSVILAPFGGGRSFALKINRWQLALALGGFVLGWLLLFVGMAAVMFFAGRANAVRKLVTENIRLKQALVKADTLAVRLDEMREMRLLMERALGAEEKKRQTKFGNYVSKYYLPTGLSKSSAFKPDKGIPELSEFIESQARLQAFLPSGLPVSGVVTAEFGDHGGIWTSAHTGIDIAVPERTPVAATADGIVAEVGFDQYYGNYVHIDHLNGYLTVYAHLFEPSVTIGKAIKRGQLVGFSGKTGRVHGPHVHYELRKLGKAVDPVANITL